MPETVVSVAYLLAGVLFILSLAGLSAQATAGRGNVYGITGMIIAVVVTAFGPWPIDFVMLAAIVTVGVVVGAILAWRVEMTAMPQLVAVLHSFVGLAAVLVGISGTLSPHVALTGIERQIHDAETFLGVFIGSVTFTG